MSLATPHDYLLTEVQTASPQRLQLLLVEAAIRFGQQARERWAAGQEDAASESLAKCQQVVTQILAGLNPEPAPELVARVAAIYLYLFRTLLSAQLERSDALLADALRVLEEERVTWREVCERVPLGRAPGAPAEAPSSMGGFSLTA